MKGCFFLFFFLLQSKDPTVFFSSGFLPAVCCECCCVSDTKRDPAALQDQSVINISHRFHYLSQSFTPKNMLSLHIDSHIGFRRLSHSGVKPEYTEYLFIVLNS